MEIQKTNSFRSVFSNHFGLFADITEVVKASKDQFTSDEIIQMTVEALWEGATLKTIDDLVICMIQAGINNATHGAPLANAYKDLLRIVDLLDLS